jgi:hypothetical protein
MIAYDTSVGNQRLQENLPIALIAPNKEINKIILFREALSGYVGFFLSPHSKIHIFNTSHTYINVNKYMRYLRPLLGFTRLNHQRNSDIRRSHRYYRRDPGISTKFGKSFGKSGGTRGSVVG